MNIGRFENKVVVVSGGGSGIGKAAALQFAVEGAIVVILDASEINGEDAVQHIGRSSSFHKVDVSDEGQVKAAFSEIERKYGRVDSLFNNAGITRRSPTADITLDDWNAVVNVNMTGLLFCAREAVALMSTGASIVNTASVLGMTGGKKPTIAYQATKGAVISMTRAWAMEWAHRRIRVNAIAPAIVRTPFTNALFENAQFSADLEANTPLGRIAEAEDIVGPVLFLASEDARMITGHILPVDGGILCR